MDDVIYLDYNATAPLRPVARDAVVAALGLTGNASSVHGFGRRARGLIEGAREAVAALVGAASGDVIFTSGGSEANNMALRGGGRRRVLVSAGEHASVLESVSDAEQIAIDQDGRVDLDDLRRLLAVEGPPALVSVMLANNETGVLQPLDQVVALARAAGALVHCDAVQAAGKTRFDMAALGVDFLTLSAHKLGGPQGVGALVLAPGTPLVAQLRGGGQEGKRRAGTENLPGIAGFGAAAAAALDGVSEFGALAPWRDQLEAGVKETAPEAIILGATVPRLANTSCFAVPGYRGETQVIALDLAGVAVSAGSACSSGKVEPSHVLTAMGTGPELAAAAVRVSLGWNSRQEDVIGFLRAWRQFYQRGKVA